MEKERMTNEDTIKNLIYMKNSLDSLSERILIESLDMAIEALEKQIPKEGIGKYTDYKCPVCGRRIRSGKGSSSYGRRDNFCQRCGQAIKWGD